MQAQKGLIWTKASSKSLVLQIGRYLLQQNFKRGNADSNLYIKQDNDSILIIEVYVDDIIFGSDDDSLSQ